MTLICFKVKWCHHCNNFLAAGSDVLLPFFTKDVICRCEDLAEIIWINRQQIRQLEMIQEGLNIPNQETSMNILPELSDGLNVLLDQLVKSSFVIEKQPPQVSICQRIL